MTQVILVCGSQIGQLLALTGSVTVASEKFVGVAAHLRSRADATTSQHDEKAVAGSAAASEAAQAPWLNPKMPTGARRCVGSAFMATMASSARTRVPAVLSRAAIVAEQGLPGAAISRTVQHHKPGLRFLLGRRRMADPAGPAQLTT